jgi:hypothetical protein
MRYLTFQKSKELKMNNNFSVLALWKYKHILELKRKYLFWESQKLCELIKCTQVH